MTYLEQCTKYFAPLDEIQEALNNREGISGLSYNELVLLVNSKVDLKRDLQLLNN